VRFQLMEKLGYGHTRTATKAPKQAILVQDMGRTAGRRMAAPAASV